MSVYFDNFLSDQQWRFRKGYSTQHCLLKLLGKWKKSVDKGKYFGFFLTELSKAFNCRDHELLTAKVKSYGFSVTALQLILDYLSNKKRRTKIDDNYSFWSEIFDVLQGSILGSLLFQILLADLFFVVKDIDIGSYADDSTLFIIENNIDNVIASLQQGSDTLFQK